MKQRQRIHNKHRWIIRVFMFRVQFFPLALCLCLYFYVIRPNKFFVSFVCLFWTKRDFLTKRLFFILFNRVVYEQRWESLRIRVLGVSMFMCLVTKINDSIAWREKKNNVRLFSFVVFPNKIKTLEVFYSVRSILYLKVLNFILITLFVMSFLFEIKTNKTQDCWN